MSYQLPSNLNLSNRTVTISVSGAVVATLLGYTAIRSIRNYNHRHHLKESVKRRLGKRKEEFEKIRSITADVSINDVNNILGKNVEEILELLRSGQYTCVQILRIFQKLALSAQEKTNCVVEFLPEAIEIAKQLDEKAKDPNFTKPPLFGLPVSIKSSISIAGRTRFSGYAKDLDQIEAEDNPTVTILKNLGAMPFVTTTVPQSLLTFSCQNPVYGTTNHPEKEDRTCGGSSGGEAALLALNGAVVGLGSDVGGSIRIPSAFCGIAGLKPCHQRFSKFGCTGSVPGRSHVHASIGPMAKSIKSCSTLLQHLWQNDNFNQLDPYAAPVPFNQELYLSKKKLKIGYYGDDQWFRPTPAVERAVLETIEHLKALGHELVPFHPPKTREMIPFIFKAVSFDNAQSLVKWIRNDLPMAGYSSMLRQASLPLWLRNFVGWLTKNSFPKISALAWSYHTNVSDLRNTNATLDSYQELYAKFWQREGVDAVLCPVQVCPAMRHDDPYTLFPTVSYTILYNALDYPAGTIPVTRVTQADVDKLSTDYKVVDRWDNAAKESAKDTVGLPVGIQIVSLPFREEVVLRVLEEIENRVQFK